MADIRIKDLTTLESASLTGDVFVIDGTTGTRKLSAFSPTFGGNVVVTGTLTSQSTLSTAAGLSCANADITGGYITLRGYGSQDGGLVFFGQSANNNFINSNATTISTSIAGSAVSNNVAAGFRVLTTTASTTTSTGALVVSGGVGVAGSINAGGSVIVSSSFSSTASDGKISITGTGNTTGVKELQFTRADGGDSTNLGLAGSAYAGVLTGLNSNDAYLYTSNSYAFRIFVGTAATNRFDFTSSQFKINPTTISTSTSSGALVVSGGVGVAGAVYTGGGVVISGSTGVSVIGGRQWSFKANSSGGSPASGCVIRDDSAAADRLTIDINGDSVFAGSLKTSAPSGGTAAAWKLGTVASVSPTSPNRTIEVDIGGTIYYIHAKTTNN